MTKALTEHQRELAKQRRCIYCGRRVTPRYDEKHRAYYPEECTDCWKMQRSPDTDVGAPDYGPGPASLQHEFARRIGAPLRGIWSEDNDDD